MSGIDVYNAVTSVEIASGENMPCAHMVFPAGSAASLPFCVYYLDEMDGFAADNTLHARRNNWVVEHYWSAYDETIEKALEDSILENFGAFTKTETWIDEENCAETAYYFAEIERDEPYESE